MAVRACVHLLGDAFHHESSSWVRSSWVRPSCLIFELLVGFWSTCCKTFFIRSLLFWVKPSCLIFDFLVWCWTRRFVRQYLFWPRLLVNTTIHNIVANALKEQWTPYLFNDYCMKTHERHMKHIRPRRPPPRRCMDRATGMAIDMCLAREKQKKRREGASWGFRCFPGST